MLFPRLLRSTLLDLLVKLSHPSQKFIELHRILLEIC